MATGRQVNEEIFYAFDNLAEKVLGSRLPEEFNRALQCFDGLKVRVLQKREVEAIINDLFAQYSMGAADFTEIKAKLDFLKTYYISKVIDHDVDSGSLFGEAWVSFCQEELKKLAQQNPAEMKESDYQARYKKMEELKNFRPSLSFSREKVAAKINEMENGIVKLSPHLLLDFFPRPPVFVIRAAIANLEKSEYKGIPNKKDKLKHLEEMALKEESKIIADVQNIFRQVISDYEAANKKFSIKHLRTTGKINTATDAVQKLSNIDSFNELAKKVPELFADSGFGKKSFNTLLLYAILNNKQLRDILKIPEKVSIPENVYKSADKKKINKDEMKNFINQFKLNLLQWNQAPAQLQEKESKQHFEVPHSITIATNKQLLGRKYVNQAKKEQNKDELALAKAAMAYCIADAYAGDTSNAEFISQIQPTDIQLNTLHYFFGRCACAPAGSDKDLNLQFLKFVMNTDHIDDPDVLILLALELSRRTGSFTLKNDPGLEHTNKMLMKCLRSTMQDRKEYSSEQELDFALTKKQETAIRLSIQINSLNAKQYTALTTQWETSLQKTKTSDVSEAVVVVHPQERPEELQQAGSSPKLKKETPSRVLSSSSATLLPAPREHSQQEALTQKNNDETPQDQGSVKRIIPS